jgi:hypothetical protein
MSGWTRTGQKPYLHSANVNAVDPLGRTALMYAAASDLLSLDEVKLLVERGADVNARDCPSKILRSLRSLKLIDFHLPRWSAQQRLFIVLGAFASMLKTSAQLRLENLALRQQLAVLRRSAPKRLKLTPADRIFWVWLRRMWSDWKPALMIVKAETVVAWHRKGFRLFWTWRIRRGESGRPSVPQEVRDLIRMISRNNPRSFAIT